MAATKTIITNSVTVGAATYEFHLVEGTELNVEENTDLVDDGQTLVSSYDVSFSTTLYDSNVMSNDNINKNTAVQPVKTNIIWNGITGAETMRINNVIVNVRRTFDQNRTAYVLTGSKRGVDSNTIAALV